MTESEEKEVILVETDFNDLPKEANGLFKRRLMYEESLGTIRYIGPVIISKNPKTIWLGIEWDVYNRIW